MTSPFRPLGDTGLSCHMLGFGCYRVVDGNSEHEAAMRAYLARGGNLIDTSANYGDGGSEELVGRVLQGIARDRVIVVTKGGYIQGRNMALAEQRNFPEVVEYGQGIWHSIHPEFLETQIELSLERLQLDSADVYLLHNPEYYLEDIRHRRELTAKDIDEFYSRVREAFRFLEGQFAAGRIRWYGVSSNNFGLPAESDAGSAPTAMTSVSRCLTEARAVSADHHFRVVQLPLNLYEPGGALAPNNDGRTVLEFCREHGIGVLANRPLNAFYRNRMVRLADWIAAGQPRPGPEMIESMAVPLRAREQEFTEAFGAPPTLPSGETVSQLLLRVAPGLTKFSNAEPIVGAELITPIQTWLGWARDQYGENPAWASWMQSFVETINTTLGEIGRLLGAKQQGQSDGVRVKLREAGYDLPRQSLSRLALGTLGGLEGLSSILVGMRRRAYVDDAFGVTEMDPVDGRAVLERFS